MTTAARKSQPIRSNSAGSNVAGYYAGGHRVLMGGVPCRVSYLPKHEGGKTLMRESSRDMFPRRPPRNRKDFAEWERRQLAAYREAEKLGSRSVDEVVTPIRRMSQEAPKMPVERVQPIAATMSPDRPCKSVGDRQGARSARPSACARASSYPIRAAALNHPRAPTITAKLPASRSGDTSERMIYGYARVSTQTQADDGESLGVQERQIRGWCMMRGEEPADILVERGVSGSIAVQKRPEGSKLWKLAKRGDTIVVARLDRLFRSALDALQSVEEMQRRGVAIVVIDGLGEITGNGMAKAFLTISAAFAELERDTIKERIATTKADQRERGRYLGGKVPFGYRVDDAGYLDEIEEEQTIISFARSRRSAGLALRKIQTEIEHQHGRNISLPTLMRITS